MMCVFYLFLVWTFYNRKNALILNFEIFLTEKLI